MQSTVKKPEQCKCISVPFITELVQAVHKYLDVSPGIVMRHWHPNFQVQSSIFLVKGTDEIWSFGVMLGIDCYISDSKTESN